MYEQMSPIADKIRHEDGSVTNFAGTVTIEAASAMGETIFQSMSPIADKVLKSDGTITDLESVIGGGGGGGTTDHSKLTNLAYANAGHTGFATSAQGAKADTALQPSAIGTTVQAKLTFDTAPKAGSSNPVTSDGINSGLVLAAKGFTIGQSVDYCNVRGDIPATGTVAFAEGDTLFNRVDNTWYTYTSDGAETPTYAWTADATQPTLDTENVYMINVGFEFLNLTEGLGFNGSVLLHYSAGTWESEVQPEFTKPAPNTITNDILAKMPARTVKANLTDSEDNPQDVTLPLIAPGWDTTNSVHMLFPTTWANDKEYDFGNGVYGKCLRGTSTTAANITQFNIINASGNIKYVIAVGGSYAPTSNASFAPIVGSTTLSSLSANPMAESDIYLSYDQPTWVIFRSIHSLSRDSSDYFVWALYALN